MMEDEREKRITREILQVIGERNDVTQRHIAADMGVALGLTNSYLKRCVKKGYVKIAQAPANRYLYYLTPKGFAEKSKLTAEYLSSSFDFYRSASDSMIGTLREANRRGYRNVGFVGKSELAEIGFIRAHDYEIEVVGTFELSEKKTSEFIGKPVWSCFSQGYPCDAVILTYLKSVPGLIGKLHSRYPEEDVLVPDIVKSIVH